MLLTNTTDLGLRLRDRRRQLGMSQAALAEAIEASRQWVGKMEQGRPGTEVALVLKAARALGMQMHLTEAEQPPYEDGADVIDLDAVLGQFQK